MARVKDGKVTPRAGKNGLAKPQKAHTKPAVLTRKERAELVEAVARLGIELHREALKELERY